MKKLDIDFNPEIREFYQWGDNVYSLEEATEKVDRCGPQIDRRLHFEFREVHFVEGEKEKLMSQDQEEKKSTLEELTDFVRMQTGAEPYFADTILFFCHKIDELKKQVGSGEALEADLKKLVKLIESQK